MIAVGWIFVIICTLRKCYGKCIVFSFFRQKKSEKKTGDTACAGSPVSSSFAKILLCVGFNRLGKDYFFFAVIAARIFAFTRARYALRRALFCSLLYCLPMELFSCNKIVVVLRFLYNVSHFSDFSNSDFHFFANIMLFLSFDGSQAIKN